MALEAFIPQLWAADLLENLNDAHVFANGTVNKDFQKNLRVGDTVRINSIGRVTIGNYTKNTWTITPEVLDGTGQTLTIDQAKYFYFAIDDIDQAQQSPKLRGEFMKEAAWAMADTVDSFLATTISAGVTSGNQLTSAIIGTGGGESDLFEILINMGVKLDVTNTPKNDRFAVIAPWMLGELYKDPRFTSFGTGENVSRAMGAAIEKMAGFKLLVSNNVPVSGSEYTILAGYKGATSYAESIGDNQPEALRVEGGFADAVKGLMVYGAKVTRPDNLVSIAVTQGSGS